MTVNRRKVLKGLAGAGVGLAGLKAPMVLAQAAPFKIGLLTVKTGPLAQGGIQMEQGLCDLPEGEEQHARGPQGRVHLGRHRRQSGGRQDQGAGADRARQGQRHPRAARGLRAAGHHRLRRATRRRRCISLAAAEDVTQRKANPFDHPPLGDLGAVLPRHGRLRREGAQATSARPRSPRTSRSATSRCRASSACSRTTAARSSRSCGRRW